MEFAETFAYYTSLSSDDMEALTSELTAEENAFHEFILYTSEVWGDKGIKAWGWFRAMQITSWGYITDYLDIEETCVLMEQVIERLRGTFTSWDEANRNYLDGTAFWMEDPYSYDSIHFSRMQVYTSLLTLYPDLFDESVWEE